MQAWQTPQGDLTLSQSTAGLAIDANLQARPGKRPAASTIGQISQRLKALSFEGLWLAPVLQLSRLDVHTDDARLTGQGQFDTQSQAARGQVQLTHPGGSAALAGTLSSNAGGGELSLRLTDAALAARWLARWPEREACARPPDLSWQGRGWFGRSTLAWRHMTGFGGAM